MSTENETIFLDVPIETIEVGERRRALHETTVLRLIESMSEQGLIQPIAITTDNVLVAGMHRLEAAKRLGWKTIAAAVMSGDSDAEAAPLREIDENLIRSMLSPAEIALHTEARRKLYEDRHPPNAKDAPSSLEETAARTGLHPSAIVRSGTRVRRIPRIAEVIGTSLDQAEELDALTALSPAEQDKLIDRAVKGEKVTAKQEAKRIKRTRREADLAAVIEKASVKIGTQVYGLLYADPPWRVEPYSRDTGLNRAPDNHYATMTTEEIMSLPVPAARDCLLALWSTTPMLDDSLRVMNAWGFEYRTHLVWLKTSVGTGYWFRNVHELLLIGVKGNVPAPAPGEQAVSVIQAETGAHSVKPDVFAELLEDMFPNVAKLEMFARRHRENWDVWGAEAPEVEKIA